MKWPTFLNNQWLYLEIGHATVWAHRGTERLELPLERSETGRVTDGSKEELIRGLQAFLKKTWPTRLRACAAIGARGVSLRRLTLPAAAKEELPRLLQLQIETDFPLPPDQLAWGWRVIDAASSQPSAATGDQKQEAATQELLVVAIKRDVIEEYTTILTACGLNPVFTLGALARSYLCPDGVGSYVMLDIGPRASELMTFGNGAPISVRTIPWGSDALNPRQPARLNAQADAASDVLVSDGASGRAMPATALDSLTNLLRQSEPGSRIYLTGDRASCGDLALRLTEQLGNSSTCQWLEAGAETGGQAAILGLKRALENTGAAAPLFIQVQQADSTAPVVRPAPLKWAAAAALFAFGLLCFPYAKALLLEPRLAHELSGIKVDRARLSLIDHELNFLQYLKENQPPYLDAAYVLADAAPRGTRIESLTMNRRGEVLLRGTLPNLQMVVHFRGKLIASGFFSNVVVEEQTPGRGKVSVRLIAHWKPAGSRPTLKVSPPKPAKPGSQPSRMSQFTRAMPSSFSRSFAAQNAIHNATTTTPARLPTHPQMMSHSPTGFSVPPSRASAVKGPISVTLPSPAHR